MNKNNCVPQAIAAIVILAVITSLGQEVRIASLDTSGRLGFTLSPTGTVTDYSCSVEWCSTLCSGGWTNTWQQPFAPFSQSNGMFYVSLPRFFRIHCATGTVQTTNAPGWTNYTVMGIIPSRIADGFICLTNNGDTGLVYSVEHAANTNGDWLNRWECQTNINTTTTVTNFFDLPMFFRVVTIKPKDGGEIPW